MTTCHWEKSKKNLKQTAVGHYSYNKTLKGMINLESMLSPNDEFTELQSMIINLSTRKTELDFNKKVNIGKEYDHNFKRMFILLSQEFDDSDCWDLYNLNKYQIIPSEI